MRQSNAGDIHFNEPGPDPDLQDGTGYRPKATNAAAYTLGAADDFRQIAFACVQDSVVTAPAAGQGGTRLDIIVVRDGPGALTIQAGPGVTLDADPDAAVPLRIDSPGGGAALTRTAATVWRVIGDFVRRDD